MRIPKHCGPHTGHDCLIWRYRSAGMHTSFPTREHFVPLLIAPGRGGPDFCHTALRKGAAIRALAAIVLPRLVAPLSCSRRPGRGHAL